MKTVVVINQMPTPTPTMKTEIGMPNRAAMTTPALGASYVACEERDNRLGRCAESRLLAGNDHLRHEAGDRDESRDTGDSFESEPPRSRSCIGARRGNCGEGHGGAPT